MVTLIEDEKILSQVKQIWEAVFHVSNKILVDNRRFGFLGMEVIPNPNIHQMLIVVRSIKGALESVVDEFGDLPHEEMRLVLNATKQISQMEVIALALRRNDPALFDEAIRELEQQAPF